MTMEVNNNITYYTLECTTGFISDMGEPCQPCGIGLYGRKCGDLCKCNANEM